jgi:ABC-2 type transport system permease protein
MNRYRAMLVAVIKKELRQTARDKRMMFMLIAAPIIQLFIFGNAVNLEVDRVPTVIVDRDMTRTSRGHIAALLADGTLRDVGRTDDVREAERWLETGRAAVVIVIPEDFESDVVRGRSATVQAILDGSDSNRAGVAGSAIAQYFASESAATIRTRLTRLASASGMAPAIPSVDAESRVFFNPALKTSIYMVPGITAMLLLLITTIVTAMGLAREKERGTLEQILVTPVPPGVLILGKILPFAAFGLVDFGLALVVGSYVFDMPLRGDFVVLFLGTILYLLTTLGMGLLISTLSGSQQQALLAGFLFMLPAALLSGIMTPVRSMPEWLQPLTMVNPLRHYAETTRGVLLRGAGFEELWPQLTILAVIGIAIFTLATARFRKTIG